MRFRVLGPIQVLVGGSAVSLGGPRQKAVLAGLLLHPNVDTPYRTLLSRVWDEPTDSASANLRKFAGRLRTLLHDQAEPSSRLTGGTGVRLRVEPGELDVDVFAELTERGRAALRAGEAADAADLFGRALALWRGDPFTGAEPSLTLTQAAGNLGEQRTSAELLYSSALIETGEHTTAVGVLQRVLDTEPTREEAARLLMLAYYRDGRRSEALDVFQAMRGRLVGELGIDPGPELLAMHRKTLTDDPALLSRTPPRAPKPADLLPPGVPAFAGRSEALAELDVLAAGDGPSIIALSGTAGIGKTSLAVHWARRSQDVFLDGILYTDLRGFSPDGRAADPAGVLAAFLEALGVPVARIPLDADARAGRYRAALADRRVLVILDNARDAAQVRPLLPGGEHCRTIVTSRNVLTGLIATDAARPIPLELMTEAEARELMTVRLGRDRVARDPNATARVIELCARLPLALAVTCAQAVIRPTVPLADLAEHLASVGETLDGFADDDPVADVRSVFSWSYAALGPGAARLFRLLSLHPGPEWTVDAAASVTGDEPGRTRGLLAELTASSLLLDKGHGVCGYHDLLRRYATELAATRDEGEERLAAVERVLAHYTHTAHAATAVAHTSRDLKPLPPFTEGTTVTRLTDAATAGTWLRQWSPVMVAAVDEAAHRGLDESAYRLAWAMTTGLARDGRWREVAAVQRTALAAAGRADDADAQAYAHRTLGICAVQRDDREDALAHYRSAERFYREAGDRLGHAWILRHQAIALRRWNRLREAVALNEGALPRFRELGHRSGEADTLNGLGLLFADLGEHRKAVEHCEQALLIQEELGDDFAAAGTWDTIAHVHHRLGAAAEAMKCAERSLRLITRAGGRSERARALETVGMLHEAAGNTAGAREAWRTALSLCEESDSVSAGELRAKLARSM